jgi:pSer/pThr/pTyr-binding forkhead associated (FHA) protein
MSGQLTRGLLRQALADVAGVLVVRSPAGLAGRSAVVGRAGVVVGRDASSDLVLDSSYVSRRHAWVGVAEGGLVVTDRGSVNGTRVAGVRVVGPTRLRVGDRVVFGDVEVELVEHGQERVPAQRPVAASGGEGPTAPMPTPSSGSSAGTRTRSEDAAPVAARTGPALALAVLGSVVGAAFTTRLGSAGEWGALAGAALGPVVSTTFTTRLSGERGTVRAAAICLLSTAALAITVTGFTFTEIAAGRPVLGGNDGGSTTFPVPDVVAGPRTIDPPDSPTTAPSPAERKAAAEIQQECGIALGTCVVTVTSTGDEALTVSAVATVDESFVPAGDTVEGVAGDTVEPPGSTAAWAVSAGECLGTRLERGEMCRVVASVDPTASGPGTYQATLVVDHNGPEGPATVALRIEAT